MVPAPFKYTIAVQKAEQRADGLYLIGEASGPEVDLQGERMAPEAIHRFADQISQMAAMGMPLTYKDAHAKDGVLIDLGVVTKAWVDERFHLGVEVRLDEMNPAAVYLWRSIREQGKQFGMSIGGKILDFVDEFVAEVGQVVRTYTNIVLTEISNTTRPAWTPSFGSVLSKAIDTAQSESVAAIGDNPSMTEELHDGAVERAEDAPDTDAEVTEEPSLAEAIANAPVVDETGDEEGEAEAEPEKSEVSESSAEETEKAGRPISQQNGKYLLELYENLGQFLQQVGVIASPEAPAAAEADAEDTTSQKSDSADAEVTQEADETEASAQARVEELERSLAETTEQLRVALQRIEALENAPATPLPPVLQRSAADEPDVKEVLRSVEDRSERLRLALSLHTQGK